MTPKRYPYDLSHVVWRHLSNAVDHLGCLRAVLGDAKVIHMYAPFTLIRGALENACGAIWLLQPPSRRERLIRRFRLAVSDIRHEYEAADLMGQGSPEARREQLAKVHVLAQRAGIAVAALKNVSYSEIVKDVDNGTPGSLALLSWRVCSGFAHGDWWTTKSVARRTEIPGTSQDGIGTFKIEANLSTMVQMTALAISATRRGWQLHDQHCRSPYDRSAPQRAPSVPEAFRRQPQHLLTASATGSPASLRELAEQVAHDVRGRDFTQRVVVVHQGASERLRPDG